MRDAKKVQGSFSYVSQLGAPLPPTHLTSSLDFPLALHRSPRSSSTSIPVTAPQKGDTFPLPKGQETSPAHAYLALFCASSFVPRPKGEEEARSFHSPNGKTSFHLVETQWLQEMQNPAAGANGNFCLFPPTHQSQFIFGQRSSR